ncbi:hypothetical protein Fcan01_08998 [Folsomia candida]|uniref:CCHC-type domain-containing protein n=1 Tax=Folsomia candida TaxID=158441 RepID=A0A226EEZ8_FOLCA|nr:hypothetical protein Fcan01_08998 [Folsomia candida]
MSNPLFATFAMPFSSSPDYWTSLTSSPSVSTPHTFFGATPPPVSTSQNYWTVPQSTPYMFSAPPPPNSPTVTPVSTRHGFSDTIPPPPSNPIITSVPTPHTFSAAPPPPPINPIVTTAHHTTTPIVSAATGSTIPPPQATYYWTAPHHEINHHERKRRNNHDRVMVAEEEKKKSRGDHQDNRPRQNKPPELCPCCKSNNHKLHACRDFADKPTDERWELVKNNHLCFRCMASGHGARDCKFSRSCGVDGCEKPHHKMLHIAAPRRRQAEDHPENPRRPAAVPPEMVNPGEEYPYINLMVLPVTLEGPSGSISTFMMLDCGSTLTVVESTIAEAIGLRGESRQIKVGGFQTDPTILNTKVVSLRIKSKDSSFVHNLQNVKTVDKLKLREQSVRKSLLKKWPHLQGIDLDTYDCKRPGILVGMDNPTLFLQKDYRVGKGSNSNSPIAIRTPLGWAPEEEMKTHCVLHFHETVPLMDISRFSLWRRLINTTAYVFRVRDLTMKKSPFYSKQLCPEALVRAQQWWWRTSQQESFPNEWECLSAELPLPKKSKLSKLCPYLDKDGVLRARGRIDNAAQVDAAKRRPSEDESGIIILSRYCVIGFAVILQIALGLLPVVVLIQDIFYPAKDPRQLSQDRIGNWCMWAVGFFAALLLNELVLFQNRVHYALVSLCTSAFCTNFCTGCILSYRGIRMSMEEHGFPLNFLAVVVMWVPYFIFSHLDFVRLTRFALRLEERQAVLVPMTTMTSGGGGSGSANQGGNNPPMYQASQLSLFVASGVQSVVAVAAFLPTTDLVYFPGKIFSILTFPSLTFIAEVIFQFGKTCRGPFLITFTAFFLGTVYSQLVWYISLVLDEEEEFLGMGKPYLLGVGGFMGVAAFLYVVRFLYVILTKWEKKE